MHVLQVEGEQLGIARHWMIFEIFDEAGLKEADSLEYVRLFYQFDFFIRPGAMAKGVSMFDHVRSGQDLSSAVVSYHNFISSKTIEIIKTHPTFAEIRKVTVMYFGNKVTWMFIIFACIICWLLRA